ncbi:MAG: RpiB/LacA/LacB family sugar-phosphate isomerase [Anaerolineales bacterium]|jgi:ribose 5-phosphate isomerase B|nr:RpiB/LacA/LacB family sugar-phosphate isomerase [Anaerolineales bacterium]
MKVFVGSDEASPLLAHLAAWLQQHGHQAELLPAALWPQAARRVAEAVASGQADEGILLCWTGTGVSIAANKVAGIRAALCADAETARGARLWNDANILCLALRTTTPALASEILQSWYGTRYQPNPNDDACLAEVHALDAGRAAGRNAGRSK